MRLSKLSPYNLLALDSFGACISAFLLINILTSYIHVFGIPRSVLYTLGIPPLCFAMFDLIAISLTESKKIVSLKIIASLNLAYCLLSLTMASVHYEKITLWGWGYLLIEVLIVVGLALLEFRVAGNLKA